VLLKRNINEDYVSLTDKAKPTITPVYVGPSVLQDAQNGIIQNTYTYHTT